MSQPSREDDILRKAREIVEVAERQRRGPCILRTTHTKKPWVASNRLVTKAEFTNLPDWDRVVLVCGELMLELDDFSVTPDDRNELMTLRYVVPSRPEIVPQAIHLPVLLRGAQVGSDGWLELRVGPEVWQEPVSVPPQPAIKAEERVQYVFAFPTLTPESAGHEHGFEWYWYSPEQRNGPRLYVRVCSGVDRTPKLKRHALELFARLLLGEEPG